MSNAVPDGLSAVQVEALRSFCHQFGILSSLRLYKNPPAKIGVEVHLAERGTEASSQMIGHDEDDFRSLLASLRQFYLDSDHISMKRVCRLIKDKCSRPELVAWADQAFQQWSNELTRPTVPEYRVGSKVYSLDEALKVLLYGDVIHSDAEKIARMERMAVGKETLRFFVHHSLRTLGRALHNVDAVISYWLDRPDERPEPPS